MYKVLCKLEGLLLNNSLATVLHNACFPMGEDLNHLMFCMVNLSRIWELARLEKRQPIIGFQHLFIILKVFASILLSQGPVKIWKYTISVYFKLQTPKFFRKWENSFCYSWYLKSNLKLFQAQKCSCILRGSLMKIMISLANIMNTRCFLIASRSLWKYSCTFWQWGF